MKIWLPWATKDTLSSTNHKTLFFVFLFRLHMWRAYKLHTLVFSSPLNPQNAYNTTDGGEKKIKRREEFISRAQAHPHLIFFRVNSSVSYLHSFSVVEERERESNFHHLRLALCKSEKQIRCCSRFLLLFLSFLQCKSNCITYLIELPSSDVICTTCLQCARINSNIYYQLLFDYLWLFTDNNERAMKCQDFFLVRERERYGKYRKSDKANIASKKRKHQLWELFLFVWENGET